MTREREPELESASRTQISLSRTLVVVRRLFFVYFVGERQSERVKYGAEW